MTRLDLPSAPRLLLEADLRPIQGTRFQPTGFPDLGAATYRLPDERGTEMLLVESAQSVANRLESAVWDDAEDDLVAPLRGLPYVKVVRDGKALTNSLLEAHRLNSVYIKNSDIFESIRSEIGKSGDQPIKRQSFVGTLCKYDPSCLLHGIFIPEKSTNALRLARALSGFIEARDVRVVSGGGVKNDRVHAGKDASGAGADAGFGNVPYHRDEYTAGSITAYFNLDLAQLRSYRLGADLERLLFGLAVFKIRRFLGEGLRLRTACDFEATTVRVTRLDGYDLPGLGVVAEVLPELIAAVARAGLFATPAITVAHYQESGKAKPEAAEGAKKKGKGK
ncbi:type I-U CRISPR-associated RAMP protein Csb1/Cas7u [Nannocystis sp. ILAH1]|uniref:type I-G CRISPR-associated RAMP protein Csb1/Cas7g n=1 Tax=Nannocystis sp. ILAH1 TaxID=2996789 RepID=UPI002270BB5E|nr:type I-U CRISPR-associated RAMP protein Csb1/Cas7u [Nannocystis sp. ILAH1]MCY0989707.1 type I-U CRISPR-associated RAMP protein Csb1/Cas7u [Nannocystis sp. ILAH1]